MTADNPSGPSRRAMLSMAGLSLAAPLVADRSQAGNLRQKSARKLSSLADLADSRGAEGVGTARGSLAPIIEGLPLDARSFGVVGDGRTDDTRATQAFLDHCAAQGGRVANFGALVVRITGPLTSRGVGIVFEPASYGSADSPGFVASGSGYTALTVTGSVADFCVTVTGAGTVDIPENGRIAGDRRPAINGIAFGTERDPFTMSTVRSVRVGNLAGYGIRHAQCWDSTFLSVSVERCGRGGTYAFDVTAAGDQTCNEVTWVRLHVEQAVGGAIRIAPNTLSCSFVKIHSERSIASREVPTWILGGSCVYDSTRLTAMNPADARVQITGNQIEFRNLRAEGVPVFVDATGGVANFHNPGAAMQPSPQQNGIVNITGGVVSVSAMGGGWNLYGCRVPKLETAFMSPGTCSTLTGCVVDELSPQPGTDQGELVLMATQVAAGRIAGDGRLRGLHLLDNSHLTPAGGTLACSDQVIVVDVSSRILGNVSLQRATLRLAGGVTGSLAVRGPVHDARASDGASVGGRVAGWGPPSVPGSPGSWSVNLAPSRTAARPGAASRAVAGWRYVADAWRPVYMDIED